MNNLIDLCGTPIQLDKIKDFRLVKRECLYYPSFQEIEDRTHPLVSFFGGEKETKYAFVKMVPFGAILSDKEKPLNGGYEIKSFEEALALNILSGIGKAFGNAASFAADVLRIDTSGIKELRVLTRGRRLVNVRFKNIPAKVRFLSGKVSDVYKNDAIYNSLGEAITPTIEAVDALVVTVDKAKYVFFGDGIDVEDAEATYHQLFEAYTQFHSENDRKKLQTIRPRLNLPKLSLPDIKIQSPFVVKKKESNALEQPIENDTDPY